MVTTIKIDDMLARKERNTVLYINYDNEAFMNTGIQESGTTPFGASTTTGPGLDKVKGKIGIKEDFILGFTLLGHKSAYFATANVAYPLDLMGKVMDAMKTPGGGFIQIFSPCPRGWRHAGEDTLKISRLATESGYWPLITAKVTNGQPVYYFTKVVGMQNPEEGSWIQTDEEKLLDFLKTQGKFRHLLKPEFLEENINELFGQVKARNSNVNNMLKAFGSDDRKIRYSGSLMKIPEQKHLNPGHGLCPGCGAGMVVNQVASAATMVAQENIIYVNNTCCLEVATSKDDVTSWKSSWMHQLFESGATVADAISTSYRILHNKGLHEGEVPFVIHYGGDGSTVNIGFQFLKSAIVRSSGYQILNKDLQV